MVLASGTALAQIITAVSMPIVTRLYTPEMIGVISVFLSFFNFWLVLLSWRYESALLISQSEEESHHVFRLSAILVFVNSLLAIPVLAWLISEGMLGFSVLPGWAPFVVFLSLLGYGWFMSYRSWLLRLQETRAISFSAISRSGANAATRVIAGIFDSGVYGLFLAEIIGSWFALGAVREKAKRLLRSPSPDWSRKRITLLAIKYKRFAQLELPSVLLNQLALVLPVPIIGALYGAQAAGWFGLAKLLYAIPNGQIGKAVGDVFQMELGVCVREKNFKRGEVLFYKLTLNLIIIGLVPLLFAIFLAPKIVPYIFGPDWTEMGDIVAYISPWMYMALIVSSTSRALSVLQKQHLKLTYDVISLLIVLISYFWARAQEIQLLDFVGFLSVGLSLAYVFYFFVISSAVRGWR